MGPYGSQEHPKPSIQQTNKANNTTTFTILPRLGQTPKQSFLVKTNNLSQATKMIRPLHLDRLPVFKNLFSSNIKVIPPTGTNKVNIKNKSSKNYTTTKKENTMEKIVKSSNLCAILKVYNNLANEL